MPKAKKTTVKPAKQKLTKEERSQVAKDRWAKRRKTETPEIAGIATNVYYAPPETNFPVKGFVEDIPIPPPVEQESAMLVVDTTTVPSQQEPVLATLPTPVAPPVELPVPQLAPVKAPKQKRTPVPREFSVALKAAESRLAKAIVERAEYSGKLAAVNAEIPSLMGIIQALKGSGSYAPAAYALPGGFPTSEAYSTPQLQDPMAAIQAAMAAPPVSRATGSTVQFGPDDVGSLEGPEDEDQFLKGPAAGSKGWI